jgi:hypothetical protein
MDARNILCPGTKIQFIPPDGPAVNGTGLRPIPLVAEWLTASPISGAIDNLAGGWVKSSAPLLVRGHRATGGCDDITEYSTFRHQAMARRF